MQLDSDDVSEFDNLPRPARHLRNLVLVAGHAVYVGLDFLQAQSEASWFLEDYQKVRWLLPWCWSAAGSPATQDGGPLPASSAFGACYNVNFIAAGTG